MLKTKEKEISIAVLVKNARKEKGMSARKLAELVDVSHTEINNIESGIRIKPSIIVLKGFEKYLDIPFKISAKLSGYSDETIKYGEDQIIVSYEMYDKKIEEYRQEQKHMEYIIDLKRHIAMDAKEYFKDIQDFLNKQDNADKALLDKANAVEKFLSEIEKKYESPFKEK